MWSLQQVPWWDCYRTKEAKWARAIQKRNSHVEINLRLWWLRWRWCRHALHWSIQWRAYSIWLWTRFPHQVHRKLYCWTESGKPKSPSRKAKPARHHSFRSVWKTAMPNLFLWKIQNRFRNSICKSKVQRHRPKSSDQGIKGGQSTFKQFERCRKAVWEAIEESIFRPGKKRQKTVQAKVAQCISREKAT